LFESTNRTNVITRINTYERLQTQLEIVRFRETNYEHVIRFDEIYNIQGSSGAERLKLTRFNLFKKNIVYLKNGNDTESTVHMFKVITVVGSPVSHMFKVITVVGSPVSHMF